MSRNSKSGIVFRKTDYKKLNGKQQEVYNFHHIAALMACHGFATYPVRDDWNGADMIARHMTSGQMMTIQVKGRVTFAEKYRGKDIWIAFRDGDSAYVYPHDEVLGIYLKRRRSSGKPLTENRAWTEGNRLVSWSTPTAELRQLLAGYRLSR